MRQHCSKSPVVTELEYMEPLCNVFESGSTTIISFAPWAKAASMVCGTPAMLVFLVAGRQKHEHVAVNCVALQATFESVAVDLYVLDHHRLRSGNDRGTSV
jgi:hypothetical protein